MLEYLVKLVLKLSWPLLIYVRYIYDYVVTTAFSILYRWQRTISLPPVFNPLLLLSATELAKKIRQRKLTSVQVIRVFLTRISDINPLLNALAQENFQEALHIAKSVDERLDKGLKNGDITEEYLEKYEPFLGVPFSVKDTIRVEGFLHTGGLLARSDVVADEDAEVVARMKRAGAIHIATTNVPELGMWWECSSPLYGRTCNPYDTRHTSGGSSGGEASLMCACGSALSIGSDTGGSIRIPCFFCGLFGHKPTQGVVPNDGCNLWEEPMKNIPLQVPGPITRHAADLLPVLRVLAGEEKSKSHLFKQVHLTGIQVYSVENDCNGVLTSSVCTQLHAAQRDVIRHFTQYWDCSVKKVKIPDLNNSYAFWQQRVAHDFPSNPPILEQLTDCQGEINVWAELFRCFLRRGRHSFPSLLQAAIEKAQREFTFLRQQKDVLQGKQDTKIEPKQGKNPVNDFNAVNRSFESYQKNGSEGTVVPDAILETSQVLEQKHIICENSPNYDVKVGCEMKRSHKEDLIMLKPLQMRIQRLLGENGILLFPSHPTLAPYHCETYFKPINFVYCAIFNALGFPVTQVPLGIDPQTGLPLGIQIVGGLHQDCLCIAVAQELERVFGGWKCPAKVL